MSAACELWRGLFPLSILTPLVALICLGAVALSALLLAMAALGEAQEWRIERKGLTIERHSLLRGGVAFGPTSEIKKIEAASHGWQDGPDSHYLRIMAADKVLETQGHENQSAIADLCPAALQILGQQEPG